MATTQHVMVVQPVKERDVEGRLLSVLDKLLLLKQQQKQQEHQQLLRQQQFLSQVMSEHHSHQCFGEPSYGHLQSAAIATANALDPSRLQPSKELFPMETSSLHLPHQVFGNANLKKSWGTIPGKISEIHQKDSLPASPFADSSPLPRLMNKSTQKSSLAPEPVLSADFHAPLSPDHTSECLEVEPDSSLDERQVDRDQSNTEPYVLTEVKNIETPIKSENEGPNADHTRFESHDGTGISLHKARGKKFGTSAEVVDSQQVASLSPAINSGDDVGATEVKGESKLVESAVSVHSLQMQSSQRAWKPAPGLKPKSFLEIQQEEQRKIQVGMAVSEISTSVHHTSSPTPWAAVVPISDPKISREIQRELNNTEINVGKAETLPSSRSKKSKLHDLLAEVVLAKSNDTEMEFSYSLYSLTTQQVTTTSVESIDDGNFI
uniref:Uncharacterized protein n=1 Tax=Populus alba TaxID=43335 RepID=A0A4U5MB94_POPAL|nr:hypothetical protein D5086_0000312430 [Populus alba]